MEYTIGHEGLRRILFDRKSRSFNRRYIFSEIMTYLQDEKVTYVSILQGLRNTGKTTLMIQAMRELSDLDAVCWMYAEDDDSLQDIKNIIEREPQCRYFFIDNITKLDDFMDTSSILASRYVAKQKKIILTGDDSLSLYLASLTELKGRAWIIHTTPMSFDEYRYLIGQDKTADDYLEHGGILSNCGLSIDG